MTSAWEVVPGSVSDRVGDISCPARRLRVPGGWLYQVEISGSHSYTQMADKPDYEHTGWHPPVFVPDAAPDPVTP